MKATSLAFVLCAVLGSSSSAQSRPDLFRCEGCESIHERSHEGLSWEAIIAPAAEPGERLVLTGRVFKSDGRTLAPNVVIYVHHTNAAGVYPMPDNPISMWHRRHGYLRAWVKTNAQGEYRFVTIRPGTYPNRNDPAHIHFIIKEPERQEYWIEDVVFTDDPLVDARYRARLDNRGGTGVVTPTRDAQGTWHARRDIILER